MNFFSNHLNVKGAQLNKVVTCPGAHWLPGRLLAALCLLSVCCLSSFTLSPVHRLVALQLDFLGRCFVCVYCSIPHPRIEPDTWKVLNKHSNQWTEGREIHLCGRITTHDCLHSVMMPHMYAWTMLSGHIKGLKGSRILVFEIVMYGAVCFHACLLLRHHTLSTKS